MYRLYIHLLKKMDGGRTLSGPVHILKGKRSATTIQDTALFGLEKWAALLKNISYSHLRIEEQKLIQKELVSIIDKRAFLTERGEEIFQRNKTFFNHLAVDGMKWEWNGEADIFWRRLTLLVQTLSWMKGGSASFIPVNSDYEDKKFVKNLLKSYEAEEISLKLHGFLLHALKAVSEEDAELFVNRLTGRSQTGKTIRQLNSRDEEIIFTYLRFRSTIHHLMSQLTAEDSFLPLLLPEASSLGAVTTSARITGDFLYKGMSLKEIAAERGLKTSTIEDHLVELAMYDDHFPYQNFIKTSDIKKVELILDEKVNLGKLKEIRNALNDELNYFEIRLALSLLNRNSQRGK
ncbi:helix-turn-helix domain-containing protein [Alkalicoccus halolimnae]|uniref:Helix-turn-helix domain-containing protein n=1 Tax=Alkalicoccus halolimnae TaxID=1667239 RepID=A0A5C7FH50_9BACI|nr:helix-turn-helix domain-containing protein [Alkalicoccus halolimnae]TXF83033.1 hypothetical protein FTX54_13605 [Alkalicoccus halolimnae]